MNNYFNFLDFTIDDLELAYQSERNNLTNVRVDNLKLTNIIFAWCVNNNFNDLEKIIERDKNLTAEQRDILIFILYKMPEIHPQGINDDELKRRDKNVAARNTFYENIIQASMIALTGIIIQTSVDVTSDYFKKDVEEVKVEDVMRNIANSKELTNEEKGKALKAAYEDVEDLFPID
jgi:hypothetical protein